MPTTSESIEGGISMFKKKEETDSLAHTRWNCKYHIVFEPKYRRQIIYGQIKADVGSIIRKLCELVGSPHAHPQLNDRPKEIPSQGKCRHDRSAPMGGQRRRESRGQEPLLGRTANLTQIYSAKGGKSLR